MIFLRQVHVRVAAAGHIFATAEDSTLRVAHSSPSSQPFCSQPHLLPLPRCNNCQGLVCADRCLPTFSTSSLSYTLLQHHLRANAAFPDHQATTSSSRPQTPTSLRHHYQLTRHPSGPRTPFRDRQRPVPPPPQASLQTLRADCRRTITRSLMETPSFYPSAV